MADGVTPRAPSASLGSKDPSSSLLQKSGATPLPQAAEGRGEGLLDGA